MNRFTYGLLVIGLVTKSVQAQQSIELPAITIEGENTPTEQRLDDYSIQIKEGSDLQRSLRALPGVYTNNQSNQPGIEITIRGLNGYGRVNTMIDGVPQTFRNVGGHTSTGGALLYVHPELVAGLSVTQGVVSGAQGSGTLAGAANMRTLGESDVIKAEKDTGLLSRFRLGNNGAHSSGLLAAGHRFTELGANKEGSVSIIAAAAYRSEGNYKTGSGEHLKQANNASNSPQGGLLKVRMSPNNRHKMELGTVWYRNAFNNSKYDWDIDNNTFTAGYNYQPGNDWINLKVNAYGNRTALNYTDGPVYYNGRRTVENSYGLNVQNNTLFSVTPNSDLYWSYGVSWDRNDFQAREFVGANYPGKIDKSSIFSNMEYQIGATTLLAGLRYDRYRLSGHQAAYSTGQADCPLTANSCGDRKRTHSGGELLPNIGLQYALNDYWSLYSMYSHTARPPTTHEVFYSGAPLFAGSTHNGALNNFELKPEQSRGLDLALSYQQHQLFSVKDKAHFRINYYQNRIRNYIVNDFNQQNRLTWVNTTGITKIHGVEVEGGYDAGIAYVNLSYSQSNTKQPTGVGSGINGGPTGLPPRHRWTLDLGARLWNERINIGTQIHYTGTSHYLNNTSTQGQFWDKTDSYHLVDLYGNYQINKSLNLYMNVENLMNKKYGYAGSSNSEYTLESGRGRTLMAGIQAHF